MMRRNCKAGIVGGLLFLVVWGPIAALAAETKPLPPATPAAQPTAPTAQPASAPAAVLAVPPDYRYSPTGKPDPFRPFLEIDLALKKKKEEEQKRKAAAMGRPISPLQQAEIAQFRLLGIAGDENRRTAIVADGTGRKFYTLFVGTYIGVREGRVKAILDDRLVVEEPVPVEAREKKMKQVQVKQVTVLLHKEQ